MNPQCNICHSASVKIFEAKVLGKYNASYYQCPQCLFIQPEKPYWLAESYSSAITTLDIGLVQRNLQLSSISTAVINLFFDKKKPFLDFAGGYGLLVRLMRDKGYHFYRQDAYCNNIFSKSFDVTDTNAPKHFELITAFEVFEHLENPMQMIDELLQLSDSILFSTLLQPHAGITPDNWWYVSPQIGQHIALYHLETLSTIASLKGLQLYTNGKNIHLLTRKKINPLLFKLAARTIVSKMIAVLTSNNTSLLNSDYEYLKSKL